VVVEKSLVAILKEQDSTKILHGYRWTFYYSSGFFIVFFLSCDPCKMLSLQVNRGYPDNQGRNPVIFCHEQSKMRGLEMEWEQVLF
jgi:hypothetical protein